MAFVPWHKFDRIRKLLEGDSEGEAGSAAYGYGKRSAQRLLQSTFEVYKPLGVAGMQGQQISFWGADLERALSFTLMRSDVYRQAFLTACEPHREIKIIPYGDECTGGNVLQVASSKRIFFTHFAVYNCLNPLVETTWLPYSCIPARDLSNVKGGFAAVMATLLRDFQKQVDKRITINGRSYKLSLHAYIADCDGCARALGAMGASALKPCMLCQNILQRQSSVPQADSSFLGVGSSETERFQPVRQTDLERLYDENLKLVNGPTGKRKQLETLLGFHIESEGVLACAVARKVLPLRKVMYDTLHNYLRMALSLRSSALPRQAEGHYRSWAV